MKSILTHMPHAVPYFPPRIDHRCLLLSCSTWELIAFLFSFLGVSGREVGVGAVLALPHTWNLNLAIPLTLIS